MGSTPPPFDWPAVGQLASLLHDLEDAILWPEALAEELASWTSGPGPIRMCPHLAGGPTTALYGQAHAPRVVVCGECFTPWEWSCAEALDGRCQACGGPDGHPTRIDAGYLTVAAHLCIDCATPQPTEGPS